MSNNAELSTIPLVLALVLGLASPKSLDAQVYVGPQLNVATETDVGIGARVLGNVEEMNLELVGSFDLYFPDGPLDFWELNGNAFYHFHRPENPTVLPYVGGGLNVAQLSNGADNIDLGLDLGSGVQFLLESFSPHIEGRAVASDVDQFVVTMGVLFGHAHVR